MNALNSIRAFLQGDGSVILPEMELLLFAIGILFIDFWVQQKEKYWNAALALAGTLFSGTTLWMLRGQLHVKGDLLGFHETAIVDSYFLFFSALFLVATALTVLLSIRYLEQANEQRGSYYALLLVACAGMMLMVTGIDLLVLFLGIETMAVSLFALLSFSRHARASTSAALKFALSSAFSSAILIFGFSLLYGLSAATNIGRIAAAIGQHSDLVRALQLSREHGASAEQMRQLIQERVPVALQFNPHALQFLPLVALILVAAGLFIKLSVVPFHFWALAVTRASPTPVAAWVSAASTVAVCTLLLRLLMTVFASSQAQWLYVVAPIALLSILWGSLAALRESNLLPLIAYLAVTQVGCILLGIVSGNETGLTGIAFYLFSSVFTLFGIFAIAISLGYGAAPKDNNSCFDGLYQRNPVEGLLFLVFVFSLIGIPGTSGFLSKYYIFKSLLETKHQPVAIAATICMLPALLVVVKLVYGIFNKQNSAHLALPRPAMSSPEAIALGICLFVTIAAGLYPEPFLRLARYAFGQ